MKSYHLTVPAIVQTLVACLIFLSGSCADDRSVPRTEMAERESILNRVVYVEPELLTEIPHVDRWCDRLELKKHRINVGDAELYVEEEGEGTPLVLINGGPGGTHHYFHPWFSQAGKTVRVIYYDQRGCGLSDFEPGDDGYSVHQAVADLDAIREALNIQKWVVLGYSYGGFLAQFYTVNHPERVAGLVLLSSSAGMNVDTGPSRQGQYISEEEKARLNEIRNEMQQLSKVRDLPRREYVQLLLYNNFLNGDWKRQGFYKPSRERLSEIALYEWDHDPDFNGIMNSSEGRVDLEGAFKASPIPTLILEGKYDLTWGEQKAAILQKNHPNAKLVMFENAGHGIYDEEPEKFFAVLSKFIEELHDVPENDILAYKESLGTWAAEKAEKKGDSTDGLVAAYGWGWHSSRQLAGDYSRDWLESFTQMRSFLRTGFALYDVEDYGEALSVFESMQSFALENNDEPYQAMALIWQGHVLDLSGRREEAIHRYSQAAEMHLDNSWMHGQYDLKYELSPYAQERMNDPFQRIDNRAAD